MPIHDWARVDAGVFHGFHLAWIAEIRKAMNNGLLPKGYYLVLAAFTGTNPPHMFFAFRAVGEEWPAFPVMLCATHGVMLPLAETYAGSPPYLRELLSAPLATN